MERRAGSRAAPARARADAPQDPGQFAWADPNLIIETMETAGFIEPEVDAVDFVMRFADFDDWWTHLTLTSGAVGEADQKLDFADAQRRAGRPGRAAEPFTQPDDRLEIPARTWVATATA